MIEYHADDYGLFPTQSRRIADCCLNGVTNRVSVMPNSPYLPECMEILRPIEKDSRIAVHLNFMEGHSICIPEEIDFLVNKQGIFNVSFGKLLLAFVLPSRLKYRAQLKKEIHAQIHAVTPYLEGRPLRIDSHSHYHMLPVVFDALMDVIQEENLSVSYIRIPEEYMKIYFSCRTGAVSSYKSAESTGPDFLAKRNRRRYRGFLDSLEQSVFCGVYEEGDIAQLTNEDDIAFLTSDLRQAEAEAFISLKSHANIESANNLCI